MSERILVVEDEPAIAEAVAYALDAAGYDVDIVGDGDAALESARSEPYDLMILDLLLPGTSGVEVCRQLRAESDLPIVMLTARDAEGERVAGLDLGADDYVTKPFSVAELVSRVRSHLRRRTIDRSSGGPVRTVGGIRLDVSRHTATVDGGPCSSPARSSGSSRSWRPSPGGRSRARSSSATSGRAISSATCVRSTSTSRTCAVSSRAIPGDRGGC